MNMKYNVLDVDSKPDMEVIVKTKETLNSDVSVEVCNKLVQNALISCLIVFLSFPSISFLVC